MCDNVLYFKNEIIHATFDDNNLSSVQSGVTTPNIVAPTMLGVVG